MEIKNSEELHIWFIYIILNGNIYKMKKINITTALLSTILIMASSCDMDIVPNGNSTLGSAKELEYLLNNILFQGNLLKI